jgi:enterochelin esterase-like enzyme
MSLSRIGRFASAALLAVLAACNSSGPPTGPTGGLGGGTGGGTGGTGQTGPVTGPPRFETFAHVSVVKPSTRNLRVYLPPGYDSTSTRRYPVLYFQPGENGFVGSRSASSSSASWGIDTTLTTLIQTKQVPPMIVVGIDQLVGDGGVEFIPPNTYCYFGITPTGKIAASSGDSYARMLVNEIKPFIDGRFRTLTDPASTGIMGSSIAGLSAFYIGMTYPTVFGRIGALSTSWCGNASNAGPSTNENNVRALSSKLPFEIFLGVAMGEAGVTINRAQQLHDALVEKGWVDGTDVTLDKTTGVHNEQTWAKQVPSAVRFLFH